MGELNMAKDNMTGTLITVGVLGAAAYLLYEWLQNQCSTPGSTLYGDFICNALGTPAVIQTAPAPPVQQPTGPTIQTSGGIAVTATLTDLTHPGGPYTAGDNWQLLITGPPNSPVVGTGSQNGATSSSTPFGQTDSNGNFILTGSWDATNVGSWVESWQVGNAPPTPLNFTVIAAPAGTSGLLGLDDFGGNRIPMQFIHGGIWE